MKKILSLMLAVMLAFSMLVVPVMAEGEPTATLTASLKGETVPVVGEKFVVSLVLSDISTGLYKSGYVDWTWPAEVASLVRPTGTNMNPVTNATQAIGGISDLYDANEGTGKYAKIVDIDMAAGKAGAGVYIHQDAEDQSSVETTTQTLYEIGFILNEGYTYDDFYLTIDEAICYFTPEGTDIVSKVSNGAITATGIEKKEEVIYYNSKHQPGVNSSDVDGVYELPQALVAGRTYEVSFTLQTSGTQGNNTLVALNNAAQMSQNNYFTNSTIMMKFDGNTDIMVRSGAETTKVGSLSAAAAIVDVKYTVDLINNTWGVTVTENGAVTVEQSGLAFRNTGGHLPIDALVLADNDSIENCFWVNADSVKIVDTTPASVGTVTFKYVCNGVELDTVEKNGETGATVSVDATTLTIGGVKYDAPAATGVVGTDVTVEVECVKYEKVAVTYVAGEAVVKTVELEGKAGDELAYDAVKFTNAGKVYEAAAGTVTVDPAALTVEVEATEVANTVAAYKTGYFNVTQNAVGVYPADRALAGTDALYSADWNDVRYGEMVFALDVEEGEAVNTAVLTLVPGDIMTSHPMTFDIYAADPATYNTANDTATLTKVGSGEWTAVDVATDVTLDLSEYFATYPEATEVLLLYKTVGGLSGVYGASTETAPYITYEIGEYVAPSQPETEPSQPETEPSQPETEPSQPETEPSQPETEPSQPETEPSQPETEPSQPETEPSQPETEPSQPETEPSQPETEPSEPGDEPSEEPVELPFEAVDVVVTPTALGVTITGKFVDEDTTYEKVVVVISYLKDGKAYSVQAVEVEVNENGEVQIPASNVNLTEGELSVAGISVLVGVNALEAITTGNLGTPVGSYK